jgi:hypothetical protein
VGDQDALTLVRLCFGGVWGWDNKESCGFGERTTMVGGAPCRDGGGLGTW